MAQKTPREVQDFLKKISAISHEKYELVMEIRKGVSQLNPEIKEKILYGGIMFSLEEDLGGVFAYSKHVSLEFGKGYLFKDPGKHLEGGGKFRRHIKFKSIEDLNNLDLDFYINQMLQTAK